MTWVIRLTGGHACSSETVQHMHAFDLASFPQGMSATPLCMPLPLSQGSCNECCRQLPEARVLVSYRTSLRPSYNYRLFICGFNVLAA